jgi:hypothetical protein
MHTPSPMMHIYRTTQTEGALRSVTPAVGSSTCVCNRNARAHRVNTLHIRIPALPILNYSLSWYLRSSAILRSVEW